MLHTYFFRFGEPDYEETMADVMDPKLDVRRIVPGPSPIASTRLTLHSSRVPSQDLTYEIEELNQHVVDEESGAEAEYAPDAPAATVPSLALQRRTGTMFMQSGKIRKTWHQCVGGYTGYYV